MSEYVNPAIVADKDREIDLLRQEILILRQFIADLVAKSAEREKCLPSNHTPKST